MLHYKPKIIILLVFLEQVNSTSQNSENDTKNHQILLMKVENKQNDTEEQKSGRYRSAKGLW